MRVIVSESCSSLATEEFQVGGVLGKATGPLPSKFWATSAPSSEDEDSDEEVDDEIMAEVPGTPKLVATATTLGFSAQDLLTAEKELQATNKVYSNSNSLKKSFFFSTSDCFVLGETQIEGCTMDWAAPSF